MGCECASYQRSEEFGQRVYGDDDSSIDCVMLEDKIPLTMKIYSLGCFSFCTTVAITTSEPAKIPDAPIPVIDLPMIKALEDGARAQTKLPISRMAT
jgi:hypothetical protein